MTEILAFAALGVVIFLPSITLFVMDWRVRHPRLPAVRKDVPHVLPGPPILPATPLTSSSGEVEIWGVVTCVRCFDNVTFPAPSEHHGDYDLHVVDSETVTQRKARAVGWASVGLFGAPAAWHCPACIELIKEVVYG